MSDPVTINYPINKTIGDDTLSVADVFNGTLFEADFALEGFSGIIPYRYARTTPKVRRSIGVQNGDAALLGEDYMSIITELAGAHDPHDITPDHFDKTFSYGDITVFANSVEYVEDETDASTSYFFCHKTGNDYYVTIVYQTKYTDLSQINTLPELVSSYIAAYKFYVEDDECELSNPPT